MPDTPLLRSSDTKSSSHNSPLRSSTLRRLSDTKFDGFSNEAIRFTTKGGQLYAIVLGWPDKGTLTIESLGRETYSAEVRGVSLIGHAADIDLRRTRAGLEITLPDTAPGKHAFVFLIDR